MTARRATPGDRVAAFLPGQTPPLDRVLHSAAADLSAATHKRVTAARAAALWLAAVTEAGMAIRAAARLDPHAARAHTFQADKLRAMAAAIDKAPRP